ncbi:MAG: hypothetical protein HN644_06495 [Rhodospirillales bacterium]|nr:hypothetical protein [Rhodospirillales bacterium]MBT4040336.1 hypothetical protein [Rhodospirillales bacterium]MBT4625063.1 hypothetical protein [Rhodospirillales bacterium]MBT5353192.1 hypothetical protein [Rhodospirillales bacterium]MBT5519386.1 hypothetical protein [Rhodospirillales bacterium]
MAATSDFSNVLGHLYDAATDMDKWPRFLEDMSGLFHAPWVNILIYDPNESNFDFYLTSGFDQSNEFIEKFSKLFHTDPRLIASNNFPGKPISCRQAFSEETWHQSATYKLIKKYPEQSPAIEYSLTMTLPDENGGNIGFALMRGEDGKAFNQEECDLLGLIIPHIKRAVSLRKRFSIADFESQTARDVMDHVPSGIIVVDEDSQVIYSNVTAQEITNRRDGITISAGALTLSNTDQNVEIKMAIRDTVQKAAAGNTQPGFPMIVERGDDHRGYPLMISTIWGEHLKLGSGVLDKPLAVVFITDMGRPQEVSCEVLQRLYGLSPTESRLLERLVIGDTLEQAASAINVTSGTARQYLKVVFQKTGTNRQPILIKTVLSSPIWMRHQEIEAAYDKYRQGS